MDTSVTVRTYEGGLLDAILRKRREVDKERTVSKTQIIDELIRKEAKRRGIER